MSGRSDRRVPEEETATVAQIEGAIEALTAGDAARLNAFASRWRGRGHLPDGRESDDLLSAAIHATLNKKRRWNPSKTTFPTFLIGVMRSLANHARKAGVTDILQLALSETALASPEDPIPLDNIRSADPHAFGSAATNPEEQMLHDEQQREARDLISAFEKSHADDWEALLVIDGWREGHDGPALRERLDLSVTQYETIVRRLRRKADIFRKPRQRHAH